MLSPLKNNTISKKHHICIHQASLHNLKQLSVDIPRQALTVITGVSGSGKSSLIFDTLFAEGQRRYVESLSTYARQFLGRMQKPPVAWIKGISPAIAIQQRTRNHNPRSTVGTMTEIYDHLRILYARIGRTYSPISGKIVQPDSAKDVLTHIKALPTDTKYLITAPFSPKNEQELGEELHNALKKGYTRLLSNQQQHYIEDIDPKEYKQLLTCSLAWLIDRGITEKALSKEAKDRIMDSANTAFLASKGHCMLYYNGTERLFSTKFERDGIRFMEPNVHMFSFNNQQGACPTCTGFGHILGMDPKKVIPDVTLSVHEGAIAPWRGEIMKKWLEPLLQNSIAFNFPIHRSYQELNEAEKAILWKGKGDFKGINSFFSYLERKKHKIQYRIMFSRFQGKQSCPDCKGHRLRKEATYIRIGGAHLGELLEQPLKDLSTFFESLECSAEQKHIASVLLYEMQKRLRYLLQVGLGYLTLSRPASTLSGGEYQRIQLATALGRPLVGAMYILDEPSIGLHPRDVETLISVLKALRDKGNPVLVIEHEERIMQAADELLDIGPGAGKQGGELVYQGKFDALIHAKGSLTADYLLGRRNITVPSKRRSYGQYLKLENLCMHNLKNISIQIPLGVLTVLTGVSGSGKSTVVQHALSPTLAHALHLGSAAPSCALSGDFAALGDLQLMDQKPIGRSSRSNPATYLKIYDTIRALFAATPQAQANEFKPSHFSFNIAGGRCETCAGEGHNTIEMQFIANVQLLCEACKGRRFSPAVLEVTYKGKSIDEVLNMSAKEALDFFQGNDALCERLQGLSDVGLDYIQLGQSSSSLSGGEAQRVKLASFLLQKGKIDEKRTFFIFDEPTTGLHMSDIDKLLNAIQRLVDMGHSVLIVEHNVEVIKCADWVIDLGPEAGEQGGEICFQGTPEALCQAENNHTARYLRQKMC